MPVIVYTTNTMCNLCNVIKCTISLKSVKLHLHQFSLAVVEAQVLLITLMMALFYLNISVSHDGVTVSQSVPTDTNPDPEIKAAKFILLTLTRVLFLL